jgi:hypothetical protein
MTVDPDSLAERTDEATTDDLEMLNQDEEQNIEAVADVDEELIEEFDL